MSPAVVDASALVAYYAVDDPRRSDVAARIEADRQLYAPSHLDVEVLSVLRRMACDARLAMAVGTRCRFDLIA